MSSAAFVKIIAVYGHIDENGHFVRKRTVPKMAITDKMVKNGRLSVKIQTFRTRFYGQTLQKQTSVRKSSS
jgi:EAL domain-containing protein (putative c-di-GMP-specific phosphodiesterase class I)